MNWFKWLTKSYRDDQIREAYEAGKQEGYYMWHDQRYYEGYEEGYKMGILDERLRPKSNHVHSPVIYDVIDSNT